jgi:hypothetical protein
MRGVTGLLGSWAPPEMPQAALERMHQVADALPVAGIRRMAWASLAVAATVLVACLVGVISQTLASGAPEAIPVWEVGAVTQQPREYAPGGSDELLTTWMLQDLSSKGDPNHD